MSSYLSRPRSLGQAQKESEASLDILGLPQQGLFGYASDGSEGLSRVLKGQGDYTFEDVRKANPKLNAMMTGASQATGTPMVALDTVGDVAVDPTNLVGAGLFSGAGKALKKAGSLKGMATGSSPNVIDDFYSLSPNKDFPPNWGPKEVIKAEATGEPIPKQAMDAYKTYDRSRVALDLIKATGSKVDELPVDLQTNIKMVVDKLPKGPMNTLKKLIYDDNPKSKRAASEVLGAYFKSKGFVKWAGETGANAMRAILSPKSRAMYRETGLTTPNQERIGKLLERRSTSGNRGAIAQAQHALYMAYRAGKPLNELSPQLRQVADDMSIDGFQKVSPSSYLNSSAKVKKQVRGKGYKTPNTVTSTLHKTALKNWGIDDASDWTMVVREPRGHSGDFVSDVNRKNNAVLKGRKIFQGRKRFTSVPKLKEAFESEGLKVVGADDKGIYLVDSGASNSYLEGGINIMTHVDTRGVANVVVSDVYDFLEKVPVINQVEKSMKNKIIGMTPPITVDLVEGTDPARNLRTSADNLGETLGPMGRTKPSSGIEMLEAQRNLGAGLVGANEMTKED